MDTPFQPGLVVALDDAQGHYLQRVMRLKAGDKIALFNNHRQQAEGIIQQLNKKSLGVEISQVVQSPANQAFPTVLVQGISRGERMDYSLQKATELGVQAIQPVFTEFSQVKLPREADRQKRQQRWQEVVIHAAQQSYRYEVPEVFPPMSLVNFLADFKGAGLLLDPRASDTLTTIAPPQAPLFVLIGPEGGLSENEVDLAKKMGFQGIRLGPRILRTETAAPVILSLLQCYWGDLC